MTPLALRLKSLAKHVASLEQDPTAYAALAQLQSALDAIDQLRPARPRGRPKHPDFNLLFFAGLVDVLKSGNWIDIKTDVDALQWLSRHNKKRPQNFKTLKNRLARGRKLRR
ncbi:hypothetical protein ABGT18_09765 [Pseudomonas putida]|uniref:hypothetical protein n=1 Tax=Pseudomonas putida TaxID=303 RepID=UPI00345CDAED